MREYVPIILVAALLMGMGGTLLAKTARKKSSYPLLITSAAMAILTFVGIIFSVAALFFPAKIAVENTMPAVIYNSETGDVMKTTLTLDGEWKYSNIFKRNTEYTGKIIIDCLDYTKEENLLDCKLEFSYFDEEKTVLNDIYDYAVPGDVIEQCALWTDDKGNWFYIDTGSKGFLVMAPAETAGEAKAISEKIDLN